MRAKERREALVLVGDRVATHGLATARLAALPRLLGQEVHFARPSGLGVYDVPHSLPRPPPNLDAWGPSNVVDLLQHPSTGSDPHLQALLRARLPEGVHHVEAGTAHLLRWVDQLDPEVLVSQALSRRARWLAEVLDLPVMRGHNAAGDRLETPSGLVAHPLLTWYRPSTGEGYKAAILDPDRTLDRTLVAEIRGWLRCGRLPDGTSIRRVHLIAVDRESAVAAMEEAHAAGAGAVYYLDDALEFWNPSP